MPNIDESVIDESVSDDAVELEAPDDGDESQPDPNAGAKKALVAERKARKAAESELSRMRAQLANKDKPAEEQAVEAAREEARAEALAKSTERVVRAEVRAAAARKLRNPALAVKLVDMSEIDVGDDGEVDSASVESAIDALIEEYPELASTSGKFNGSADQGARGRKSKEAAKPTQNDLLRAAFKGR